MPRQIPIAFALLALFAGAALAQGAADTTATRFDEALARSTGADERGMRHYVLVILKTGPTPVPAGPERDAMFRGHFANITRLSEEGKLLVAGPLDGVDGWRGLFVFDVPDIEAAKPLVASDPVVQKGEMVPEYHAFYSSAALKLIPETHEKLVKPAP